MTGVPVELVALEALAVKPREFSARRDALDPAHVADLTAALTDGQPLDPVDVWRSGRKLFVVDGFHRIAAYREAKWLDPVPVRVHAGPRLVAWRLAVEDNAKSRLVLTQTERADWAWKLVRAEQAAKAKAKIGTRALNADERALVVLTKPQIAAMTGVSERLAGDMRAAWAQFDAREDDLCGPGTRALTGSWQNDRRTILGEDMTTWTDEQQEAWRQERQDRLCREYRGLATVVRKDSDAVVAMLIAVLGKQAAGVARDILAELGEAD